MENTFSIWLDISDYNGSVTALNAYGNYTIAAIMLNRMAYANLIGYDAVHTDNIDASEFDVPTVTGVNATDCRIFGSPITTAQQITYNQFLADTPHSLTLSIGLANGYSMMSQLAPYFDFAIVESCLEGSSCISAEPFLREGKPVLAVEYDNSTAAATCEELDALGFDV